MVSRRLLLQSLAGFIVNATIRDKCSAQVVASNQMPSPSAPVPTTNSELFPINYNLPVFHAERAMRVVESIKATVSGDHCAGACREMLDQAGVPVPLPPDGEKPKASDYIYILPTLGFISLGGGDGSDFNVGDCRASVTATLGDPNHPVFVVMTEKDNPSAAGHIFYVDQYGGTTSDFIQFGGTGLKEPQDYLYEALVYSGPSTDYNVRDYNVVTRGIALQPMSEDTKVSDSNAYRSNATRPASTSANQQGQPSPVISGNTLTLN